MNCRLWTTQSCSASNQFHHELFNDDDEELGMESDTEDVSIFEHENEENDYEDNVEDDSVSDVRARSPHTPRYSQSRQEKWSEPVPEQLVQIVIDTCDEGRVKVEAEDFSTPDAHELYTRPEYRHAISRFAGRRLTSDRGGRRGRTGRGRPLSGRRYDRWNIGDPLQLIYITDADVPPALVNMAMDVVRTRQERMQAIRDKITRRVLKTEGDSEENEQEDSDNEFQDSTDEGGTALLDEDRRRFDWFSMDTFRGVEEMFQPQRTGSVLYVETAYEAFRSYWDDKILQLIVDQTNLYATKIASTPFQKEWYPTNQHEILCLFAFWIMLGIIRMPTIASCFSMNMLLKTEIFRRIFSQHRYKCLTKALNFVNADAFAANIDRLHRIRPILEHLNKKFQENYVPSQDISIEENLTLWKGCLKIKTFELRETTTSYLWSFLVYRGTRSLLETIHPLVHKTTAVVLKLINPLLNKGYRLFIDNWVNLPVLARYLKLNKTDCVGTLRPTLQNVPVLLSQVPLKQGEFMARHSGDVCVLTWQDKERITMLSTCHGAATALPQVLSKPTVIPLQFKPHMVLDFIKAMDGVGMKDQMLEPYLLESENSIQWHMRLFNSLLNSSIINARILLESSTNSSQSQLIFRLKLVDSILTSHLQYCPSKPAMMTMEEVDPVKVNLGHWPIYFERTEHDIQRNRHHRKRCVVCLRSGKKNQMTPYVCEVCNVPLCVINCFKTYHT